MAAAWVTSAPPGVVGSDSESKDAVAPREEPTPRMTPRRAQMRTRPSGEGLVEAGFAGSRRRLTPEGRAVPSLPSFGGTSNSMGSTDTLSRKTSRKRFLRHSDSNGETLGGASRVHRDNTLEATTTYEEARKRAGLGPKLPSGLSTKMSLHRMTGSKAEQQLSRGSSRASLAAEERHALEAQARPEVTAGEKVAYRVDKGLSAPGGKARGLAAFAILQVLVGGVLIFMGRIAEGKDEELQESIWTAWTYIADPGTHADESAWVERLVAFLTTFMGVMFFAVVVGFVVDGIRERMDNLKKGRSRVVESDHYLLLGFEDKSFALIQELCLAMESEGGGKVVVLCDREKTELESELSEHFTKRDLLKTEIVVRSGSVMLASELSKVSATTARSVVVMATPGDADKSDAQVLRTVLALNSMKHPPVGHIVAEVRDIDNEALVEIVGRGQVETVVAHDVIGRLLVNCARHPGLADCYEMLLGFDGDEFYLENWPTIKGVKFGDLTLRFPDAIPLGVLTPDGHIHLNPPNDFTMGAKDMLLVLAEDDDTYQPCPAAGVDMLPVPVWEEPKRYAETMLMCGWRRDVDDVIELMDALALPGSELHMLNELTVEQRQARLANNGMYEEDLTNLRIVHHKGNPAFRRDLEPLPVEMFDSVMVLADEQYEEDSMHSDSQALASLLLVRHLQEARGITFGPSEDGSLQEDASSRMGSRFMPIDGGTAAHEMSPTHAGVTPTRVSKRTARMKAARTAGGRSATAKEGSSSMSEARRKREMVKHNVTEASEDHKRAVAERQRERAASGKPPVMICELLDARTKSVIMTRNSKLARADFILSNNIIARVLAMVAERREVKAVLNELLGPDGNEVSLYPASKYVAPGTLASFWQLAMVARQQREILLGYKVDPDAEGMPASNKVADGEDFIFMNPRDKAAKRFWAEGDQMIVMCDPSALKAAVEEGSATAEAAGVPTSHAKAASESGAGVPPLRGLGAGSADVSNGVRATQVLPSHSERIHALPQPVRRSEVAPLEDAGAAAPGTPTRVDGPSLGKAKLTAPLPASALAAAGNTRAASAGEDDLLAEAEKATL